MARRRDFEKANRIAKVKKHDFERYQEGIFGKEPKDKSNPSANRKLTKKEEFIQKYFKIIRQQKEKAKRELELKAKAEKELRKKEKAAERKAEGEESKELVFTARHPRMVNYGKLMEEEWRFDSDGNVMYFAQAYAGSLLADASEYLCVGFPQAVIDRLKAEIAAQSAKTPSAILRIERVLIDRLSRISTRKQCRRISEGMIRQVFWINKKALKRALELWPEFYSQN